MSSTCNKIYQLFFRGQGRRNFPPLPKSALLITVYGNACMIVFPITAATAVLLLCDIRNILSFDRSARGRISTTPCRIHNERTTSRDFFSGQTILLARSRRWNVIFVQWWSRNFRGLLSPRTTTTIIHTKRGTVQETFCGVIKVGIPRRLLVCVCVCVYQTL